MENRPSGFTLTDLVAKNINKLLFLEKVAVSFFVIGLVLYIIKKPYADILVITGSILLAICYFLSAFKMIETENMETTGILNSIGFINFIYKLNYFSLAISAIAVLGLVVELKNNNSLLFIGGISLLIILILSLITKLNDRSVIYNTGFYMRILICLIILAYLAFVEFNIK